MNLLFISYRRTDDPNSVKLLCERLRQRLPNWEVFYDHESIAPGEAFPDLIRKKIAAAAVVLIVIGPRWLETIKQRAQNRNDFVREEVRLALEAGHTVMPIAVSNAHLPGAEDLADFPDLLALCERNGHSIRPDPDFESDIDRLVAKLERIGPGEEIGSILAGKYQLTRKVGEENRSIVYAANHLQTKRVVAIKLINAGSGRSDVLARFESERLTLAQLDHPRIAKVLDAGTSASGRPFFVMEFVNGLPITEYCDHRKLAPRHRLALFMQVCDAVQHAHQKGIIHRDIEPGNVLVEEIDGKSFVKVIDFGLARALGPWPSDSRAETESGEAKFEYASPEQVSGLLFVDTRTDIYSLGVILYELLAGQLPFDRDGQAAVADDLKRQMRDDVPPTPSAKLYSSRVPSDVAANRGLSPVKLPGLVRGDLDAIVMKALKKAPNDRYDSASSFKDDVSRHLRNELVLARKTPALVRFGKFVSRNKGPVLAVSLVLLALGTGAVGATLGLLEARRQKQIALDEAAKKEHALAAEFEQKLVASRARLLAAEESLQAQLARDQARGNLGFAVNAIDSRIYFVHERAETQSAALDILAESIASLRNSINSLFATLRTRNWRETLAWGYLRAGDFHWAMGDRDRAYALYDKAYLWLWISGNTMPAAEAGVDFSAKFARLGDLKLLNRQYAEAIRDYEKALYLAQRQTNARPESHECRNELAIVYDRLGDASLCMGNTSQAARFYAQKHQLDAKSGEELDLNSAKNRFVTLYKLGAVEKSNHEYGTAADWFDRAGQQLQPWHDRKVLTGLYQNAISIVQQEIVMCRTAQRAIAELEYVFAQKRDMIPLLVDTRLAALLSKRQIVNAVDTVKRFEEWINKDGEECSHRYCLARHYCRCATYADGDKDDLAKRAMQHLLKAREEKYFDARRVVQLTQDGDLDLLRDRKDFQEFVAELELAMRESKSK